MKWNDFIEGYKERFNCFGKKLYDTIISLLVIAIWLSFLLFPVILDHFFPEKHSEKSHITRTNNDDERPEPPGDIDWLGRPQ